MSSPDIYQITKDFFLSLSLFFFTHLLTQRNSFFLLLTIVGFAPWDPFPKNQTQSGPQPSIHHLNLNTDVDLGPGISTQTQYSAFAVSD